MRTWWVSLVYHLYRLPPVSLTKLLSSERHTAYGCASVIGPLHGGVSTFHATWRWCFYVNLPIGGASAFVIMMLLQAPAASKHVKATLKEKILQMDPLGSFTFMAAVICYLLALQWDGVTKSWSDPSVIGTFVGFGLLLIIGLVEWYMGDRALLQGALLRRREIGKHHLHLWRLRPFPIRRGGDNHDQYRTTVHARHRLSLIALDWIPSLGPHWHRIVFPSTHHC